MRFIKRDRAGVVAGGLDPAPARPRRTQLSRPYPSHGPVPMDVQFRPPAWSLLDSMTTTRRWSSVRPMTATGRSLPMLESSS